MIWASPNFSLDELTFSETAARKGIDNTPSDDVLDNLLQNSNGAWKMLENYLIIILYLLAVAIVVWSLIHYSAVSQLRHTLEDWLSILLAQSSVTLMTLWMLFLSLIFSMTRLFWSLINGFIWLFQKMERVLGKKR